MSLHSCLGASNDLVFSVLTKPQKKRRYCDKNLVTAPFFRMNDVPEVASSKNKSEFHKNLRSIFRKSLLIFLKLFTSVTTSKRIMLLFITFVLNKLHRRTLLIHYKLSALSNSVDIRQIQSDRFRSSRRRQHHT